MPFYKQAWLQAHPEVKAHGVSLGHHPTTFDELVILDKSRFAGTYVLGVQGVGKSAFLETLIQQDFEKGNGVIVIDAHGDLINHCLAALPQRRVADTFMLDIMDEEFPFGANIFSVVKPKTEVERSQAAARIEHLFEVLWAGALDQQFLPRFVRAVTFTFLDNPGATLVDMLTFLQDDEFRARMVANVTAPDIRAFWKREFNEHGEAERNRRMQPLIGRLEGLFLGRTLVRNIAGQRQNSVSFRRAIEERQIILVRLPIKELGNDAKFVGKVLIAQIHAAIFSFANVPEEQRPGVSVYIDEFQNFTTGDIEELFTEGRKYGVRLTIAHQIRSKLPEFLQEPTMTARTKVVFQTTAHDAREMSALLPARPLETASDDIDAHPVKYLLDYPSQDYLVRTFVETYLRPLQRQKSAGIQGDVDLTQAADKK